MSDSYNTRFRRILLAWFAAIFSLVFFTVCEQPAGPVDPGLAADDPGPAAGDPAEEAPLPGLVALNIASLPEINVYALGQSFDAAGLVVEGVYDDESVATLEPGSYTVSGIDTTLAGAKMVTVTKGKLYTQFPVMVQNSTAVVVAVAVAKPPNKTVYALGETFSTAGMVVSCRYSDGTENVEKYYSIVGYNRALRGPQTIKVKVNQYTVDLPVTVRIPANATVSLNAPTTSHTEKQAEYYKIVHIKGTAVDIERLNLRAKVTANGVSAELSPGKGLAPSDLDASGFDPNQPGRQSLKLVLDDKEVPFGMFVADEEPRVFFDYGYRQTASDPAGAGPGAGEYYARPNETLVLAPMRFLIGFGADHKDEGVSAAWSVSGPGNYTSSSSGEFFYFTPGGTGTWTVTVSVTGRSFVTGGPVAKSASTRVVCYTGTLPAPEGRPAYNPPLKNFSPGQFIEGGSGFGWSLGSALGYEVWTLPAGKEGSFSITGNAFAVGGGDRDWNEPGIVWVQDDKNGNGVPDEVWYELKGSEDSGEYSSRITRRYAITHFKTNDAGSVNEFGQLIREMFWLDNKGRAGVWGGGWPLANDEKITYTGTLLRDGDAQTNDGTDFSNIYGYVDVFYKNSTSYNFSTSDAIQVDGSKPANFSAKFVKVQTGVFLMTTGVGEISTEIVMGDGLPRQDGGFTQ